MPETIAIIHYQPLELYPPVMNFLNSTTGIAGGRIDVYTTYCHADISNYASPHAEIRIHRYGARRKKKSRAGRAWHYFRFHCLTLLRLLFTRPRTIMYFETFSAFPACVYKRFINRDSRIFIHYHEYMTPQEYAGGMLMIKWFHRLEKKIYPLAEWVSHTNEGRMKRFSADLAGISIPAKFVLPNYPPASWQMGEKNAIQEPVKIIYIGACGLDTMYIREFAQWVLSRNGKVVWDVYSLNITPEAAAFFGSLSSGLIRLFPGVSYSDIPHVLVNYDIGVILYKGHIPNWIDNAPNKLFEYYNCGLDVWLPVQMTGSLPYVTHGVYPKIIAIDFQQLETLDLHAATNRSGLTYRPSTFYCEQIYEPLWQRLLTK